jgi:CDP-diacylglycerol--serine O-phosphatidyltransferase
VGVATGRDLRTVGGVKARARGGGITRLLRYLAPNLITTAGIVFGMLSLVATHEGRYVEAAWLIIYAVLTDRMDGFVARLVRGTSELGVQLDSLADFLAFGLAPAFLVFVSLGEAPGLPFNDGGGRVFLMGSAGLWVLGACFRLARYNITTEVPGAPRVFFGVPTTLAAGTLAVWYLTFLKYAPADVSVRAADPGFRELRLFGGGVATPDGVWQWFPIAMLLGAFLMASNLRIPKLGVARSKAATAFVATNVALGYICGFARVFPEYMIWPPTMWLLTFLVWGQLSPAARQLRPPPILPPVDAPVGQEPRRPEDDLLHDHEVGNDDLQF